MNTSTMKEARVHSDTTVTIHDVPIPEISHPSQILVKVVVSGTNPKVSPQINFRSFSPADPSEK